MVVRAVESAAHLSIRPFAAADYAAMAGLRNSIWPHNMVTAERLRHKDRLRWSEGLHQRWVAEVEGHMVGVAECSHSEWSFHPRKFVLRAEVSRSCQGRGVGKALYDVVMEALAPHDPILVRAWTRADMGRAIRFLADRGFEEEERNWESRLDVTTFDPRPFTEAGGHIPAPGITIRTWAELAERPDHLRRMYDLDMELSRDIPSPEPMTPWSFERWSERLRARPDLLPEGQFLALNGDEYVGLSALWTNDADDDLLTGITGVRRPWRRKGIALALKLRAIAYARACGAPGIRTDNSSLNIGMLAINERLGFQRYPAWINFKKVMADG